jgi:nicotinamidase-related amidase
MPLSAVDAAPALVVVDLQAGIVGRPLPGMAEVVARSAALAEAFRDRGHLVVLVNVEAGPRGRSDQSAGRDSSITLPPESLAFAPELGRAEDDLVITKRTRGAFHGTALAEELAARGITQVFVTGVATGSGVEATAREAHAHDLHVVTVTDAMLDTDPEIHDFVIRKVFPKFAETATTEDVLGAL